ncbi:hypothetical protein DP115_29825 [Brasilonema octagenarum UFV-OR1]|uniref:Transposase n=1 Tax=Brasilonema octagenarum UFV-OR1 TaxID=417115 RepID=A0ABX1MIM4_9CYAN|nr:hypothetical protein [Brasilonema octagenarum UFV-OR1]
MHKAFGFPDLALVSTTRQSLDISFPGSAWERGLGGSASRLLRMMQGLIFPKANAFCQQEP